MLHEGYSKDRLRELKFRLVLPHLPDLNHQYILRTRRIGNRYIPQMVKKPETRVLEENVRVQIMEALEAEGCDFTEWKSRIREYHCRMQFLFGEQRWLTKANKMRRLDLANVAKPVEDFVASALGVDDKFASRLTLEKKFNREDDNLRADLDFTFYLS